MNLRSNIVVWATTMVAALAMPLVAAQANTETAPTPPITLTHGGPIPQTGDLWVSPNGSDTHSGTQQDPLLTLSAAIEKVTLGQTIWMTEGVHKFTETVFIPRRKDGTSSQPYRIAGAPGGPRHTLDFYGVDHTSEIRGIQLDGDYWNLLYLEIYGAADNALNVNGSYNTLELLALYD